MGAVDDVYNVGNSAVGGVVNSAYNGVVLVEGAIDVDAFESIDADGCVADIVGAADAVGGGDDADDIEQNLNCSLQVPASDGRRPLYQAVNYGMVVVMVHPLFRRRHLRRSSLYYWCPLMCAL